MKLSKLKPVLLLLAVLSLCFSLAGSAFAFSDIGKDKEKEAIESLHKRGIVSGIGKGKFSPQASLSAGNAVALIVKGMELNIDDINFIKKPKASDYFTKVKDNAWYAESFIIAHHHNLGIPRDINPNAAVTREQFAHWLYSAIEAKGEYAWIELYISIKDEDQINKDWMTSIQRLLIGKIAALDEDGNFRPKKSITRSEAAGMLHRAIEFVKNVKPIEPVSPELTVLTDVKLSTEKVNDDIQKVTVSAKAPHPGYGLEISGIEFNGDQAVISYRLILPDPSAMYAQVIADVNASTYVSSSYEAVLGGQTLAQSRKQESGEETKIVPIESGSEAVPGNTGLPVDPDQPVESSGGGASGSQGVSGGH